MVAVPDPVVSSTLSAAIGDIYTAVKATLLQSKGAIENELRLGFTKYLIDVYDRWSLIKTLLDRAEPVPLRQYYVSPDVAIGEKKISEADLLNSLHKIRCIVVTGTAGAGKSLLLRHLLLSCVEGAFHQIPIFIEARTLNDSAPIRGALFKKAVDAIQAYLPGFSAARLDNACRNGKAILFVDGLDELSSSVRQNVLAEIDALSAKYLKLPIICSSRPDRSFASWERFTEANLLGLSKDKALRLVANLRCDAAVKEKFVTNVIRPHFAAYQEFLSVPLLVVMMLIVYSQHGEIPHKMANFYRRAFETLFSGHDVLKGGFRRENASKLQLEDFSRVFAAFCAITYVAGDSRFSKPSLIKNIASALSAENVSCDAEAILDDMLRSVCVLQEDGLEFSFVHRSFQEYFAAVFFLKMGPDNVNREKVITALVQRNTSDRTSVLMGEIDRATFERQWLLPLALRVSEQWLGGGAYVSSNFVQHLDALVGRVAVSMRDGVWGLQDLDLTDVGELLVWVLAQLDENHMERDFRLHYYLDRAVRMRRNDGPDGVQAATQTRTVRVRSMSALSAWLGPRRGRIELRKIATSLRSSISDLQKRESQRNAASRDLFA